MENWEQIGDTGYLVSNYGRVMNPKKVILRPVKTPKNYLVVSISRRQIRVHRLVAKYFIPNPNILPEVNHKDCNKHNNHVDNLEWISHSDNIAHAVKNGIFSKRNNKGSNNGSAILTESEVLEIRSKHKRRIYTRDMLAAEYNVKVGTIKNVLSRRTWKHVSKLSVL